MERAFERLGIQWFDLWLRSVDAGPEDFRLTTDPIKRRAIAVLNAELRAEMPRARFEEQVEFA